LHNGGKLEGGILLLQLLHDKQKLLLGVQKLKFTA